MAARARHGNGRMLRAINLMHNVSVTFTAGVLGHAKAALLDLDRIVKFARCERERMKKPVLSFGEILGKESSRRVSIVTGRDRAMAGFNPTVESVLHALAL